MENPGAKHRGLAHLQGTAKPICKLAQHRVIRLSLFLRQVIFIDNQVDTLLRRLDNDKLKLAATHLIKQVLRGREGWVAEIQADLQQAVSEPLMLGYVGQARHRIKGVTFLLAEVRQNRLRCLGLSHCRRGAPL